MLTKQKYIFKKKRDENKQKKTRSLHKSEAEVITRRRVNRSARLKKCISNKKPTYYSEDIKASYEKLSKKESSITKREVKAACFHCFGKNF
jgi:hypothetical protein